MPPLPKRTEILPTGERVSYLASLRVNKHPMLVFLHGATASAEAWLPVWPHIRADLNLISIDLPGRGQSNGPARSTISELADFIDESIQAIRQALDLTGDGILIGHSLGGGLALELGIRHPSWLSRLILVTTSPNLNVVPENILDELKNGHVPTTFFKQGFSPASSPKLLDAILSRQTTPTDTGYADFKAGQAFDRLADLDKINVPTLIVSASDDDIMPKMASGLMADLIPNSRLQIIEKAGHFVTLEQPATLAQKILDYSIAHTAINR